VVRTASLPIQKNQENTDDPEYRRVSGCTRAARLASTPLVSIRTADPASAIALTTRSLIHKILRVTPTMDANLTNHIWTLAELLAEDRSLHPRARINALAAVVADVCKDMVEAGENVQIAAMGAPRRSHGAWPWFTFLVLRSESLERQQDGMASIADELEVRRARLCVAIIGATGFAECPARFTVFFPPLQIRNRFARHCLNATAVRQWIHRMAQIS
jgi:hypothetical protein